MGPIARIVASTPLPVRFCVHRPARTWEHFEMARRPVLIWPEPALTTPAEPVAAFDAQTRALVSDMFETMYAEKGIGLAANQIGVLQQVLVIDLDPSQQAKKDEEVRKELQEWNYTQPLAVINPRLVAGDGQIVWDEGCLSLPGITETIKRKANVTVQAYDVDGQPITIEARGLFAVCLQHEMDHLAGKMFVDYLSKLKRDVIRRKMQRLKVEAHELGDASQAAGS